MNEIIILLETLETLSALEGHPLARDASLETVCADIASRYDFLHSAAEVQLMDSMVRIRSSGPSEEDQAEAGRLFERAGRRARDGEYVRVVALCRQALSLQPALHQARRELVRAYFETDDRANAQAALWQALRLNPRDAWSLVALAGLLVEGGEADKVERLARMALELGPANAQALEALGQAQLRAGHEQEALGAFGRALWLKPQLVEARLGSARALLRQNKAEESLALLAPPGVGHEFPHHRPAVQDLLDVAVLPGPALFLPGTPDRHLAQMPVEEPRDPPLAPAPQRQPEDQPHDLGPLRDDLVLLAVSGNPQPARAGTLRCH
ncbi:MAG TPA: hypothetical protein VN829_19335 [Dongiaceae bacterium]|nr:hypothetical protein [Dongiaceae bacterium]